MLHSWSQLASLIPRVISRCSALLNFCDDAVESWAAKRKPQPSALIALRVIDALARQVTDFRVRPLCADPCTA